MFSTNKRQPKMEHPEFIAILFLQSIILSVMSLINSVAKRSPQNYYCWHFPIKKKKEKTKLPNSKLVAHRMKSGSPKGLR